ncbi:MAG TPA: adenylate/guanylate cyclase domain-containing protein [Acidimicrobiia bacterium]|nr:adenylate/guanylate cyclase domain-containing protein [Acidimicrobiia bacterium]
MGDLAWRDLLARHDAVVEEQAHRWRGRVVKKTGDGMLATFDGPARAIRAGLGMVGGAAQLGLQIRVGIHTGEAEIIGSDVGGIAVHIGARVAAQAGAGDVLVSRTVKDLVAGSGIDLDDRGEFTLKGVPGVWNLFAVHGG